MPTQRRIPAERPRRQVQPMRRPPHAQAPAAPHAAAPKRRSRYVPALDGLRAIAVIAVMLYHLQFSVANGGLLGVTVFFVLSGYLITGILATEILTKGHVDLKRFWLRRIRRLFPAIVFVIVITALACLLLNHPLLTKMKPDIVPSLFWFQNWWYVLRDLSYFENLGSPSPLTHFWSLAIEEQFYLVWPLILPLVFKLSGNRRKPIAIGCLLFAAASALWMAVLYDPAADPTRVYYGTDTRACSLLLGAALGVMWSANHVAYRVHKGIPAHILQRIDLCGIAALAVLVVMMALADGMSAFMYRGGIVLASLLTAVVIAALVLPNGLLAHIIGNPVFVWIGKRSYGMYLWHFPIICLLSPYNDAPSGYAWWFVVAVFVLTFAISALSYRFVEDPIRHGALGKMLAEMRSQNEVLPLTGGAVRRDLRRTEGVPRVEGVHQHAMHNRLIPATCALAFLLCVGTGIVCAVAPDESFAPQDAIQSTGTAADQALVSSETTGTDAATTQQAAVKKKKKKVYNPLLIGDSVPGDANSEFKKTFKKGLNDSYIGRWTYQGIDVLEQYKEKKRVGKVVVFAVFSNHKIADGELTELYKLIDSDQQLFLVNAKVPGTMQDYNNNLIWDFAQKHDNVHVVDWYSACVDHVNDYLWGDKTHLTPDGAKVYIELIREAVEEYL